VPTGCREERLIARAAVACCTASQASYPTWPVRCDRSATTLKHPDTAHDMSITDLAAASGVAESTVSRFVQAIGVTTAGIKHARSR
jgi:hypothetical protein